MHARHTHTATGSLLLTVLVTIGCLALPYTTLAEPCTLYKAQDVANARLNVKRYRWAGQIVAGWRRRVAPLMEQDHWFVEEMIGELTLWSTYGQNCPACVNTRIMRD